jgi:HEAT repeat protein
VAAQEFETILTKLFDAEREARRVHDELASRATERGGRDALVAAIQDNIRRSDDAAPDEAAIRLVCLARLLGELDGADVADALIDVLDTEHPEARNEAGEQLQGLAFDRFKEVAEAVERALGRLSQTGSHALVELPYVLVEVPEGGVVPLLSRFLAHPDPDAVAAAIEALVEVGDPTAVGALRALTNDARTSVLGEEDDQQAEVTLGELASEAIELLEQIEA